MGQSWTRRRRGGGKEGEGVEERRMSMACRRTRTHWPGAYSRRACVAEAGGEEEVWEVEREEDGRWRTDRRNMIFLRISLRH
jgi:hypothetical protein